MVQEEEEDFEAFEGIDAEQLRQMMSDPRYAALFAEHCNHLTFNSFRRKHAVPKNREPR